MCNECSEWERFFRMRQNGMNERKQNRVNKPMCVYRVHCPLFQMVSSLLLRKKKIGFERFLWVQV